MTAHFTAVLMTVGLSVVGVLADYFLRLASEEERLFHSRLFMTGTLLYASTAFGWVWVMKHLKLSHIGVIYSLSIVILLIALGVIRFQEKLIAKDVVGLALGITSLVLLARHT